MANMAKVDGITAQSLGVIQEEKSVQKKSDFSFKHVFGIYNEKDAYDLKKKIGIPDSNLSTSQLKKIADFQKETFKEDSVRIENLKGVAKNTMLSLSDTGFATAVAKGQEERFLHAEGSKFVLDNKEAGTKALLEAKQQLVAKIADHVKTSDMYVMQKGSSLSAVPEIEYLVDGILRHARAKGLAAQFLGAAMQERKAALDPTQARQEFINTLLAGISQDLLSLEDPRLISALEDVAVEAMLQVEEENKAGEKNRGYFGSFKPMNPDDAAQKVGEDFRCAGLLPDGDLARFLHNVYKKAEMGGAFSSTFDPSAQVPASQPAFTEMEAEAVVETSAQKQERISQEATANVEVYLKNLQILEAAQKDLLERQAVLKMLLKERAHDDLSGLSRSDLRSMIAASRLTHLPVSGDPSKENLNVSIETQKGLIEEQFACIKDVLQFCTRPESFDKAEKQLRSESRKVEGQVRDNDLLIAHETKRIAHWDKLGNKTETKIQASAAQGVELAFGVTSEEELPDFMEVVEEKKPGFFERLFSSKPKKEAELPDFEEEVLETATIAASDDVLPDVAVQEALPPVQEKKRWW